MSETSKTIAFRVAPDVEEQIQAMAIATGQGKGEWVRDRVMEALHGASKEPTASSVREGDTTVPSSSALEAIEAQMRQIETTLRNRIEAIAKTVEEHQAWNGKDITQLRQNVRTTWETLDQVVGKQTELSSKQESTERLLRDLQTQNEAKAKELNRPKGSGHY